MTRWLGQSTNCKADSPKTKNSNNGTWFNFCSVPNCSKAWETTKQVTNPTKQKQTICKKWMVEHKLGVKRLKTLKALGTWKAVEMEHNG